MNGNLEEVGSYWDTHHLGTQFLPNSTAEPGSKEYFEEFDRSMERWEYKNTMIDWIASQSPGGRLLEVGCGLGQDLSKFAGRGMRVTGIDLAPSVAHMAQLHLRAYGLEGETMQGNAEALQFEDGSFDTVYSCGVLQHTPDIQRAINEIYRVTAEGGLAVVVVYYRYSWFNLISKLSKTNIEFEDEDAPIINTYSKRELRGLFSQFQEVDVSLEYCYPSPTPRTGFLAGLYNGVFVRASKLVPYFIMRNYGWHVVVKARRGRLVASSNS